MRLRQRPAARRDLAHLYRQSIGQFGAAHAERYFEGLVASIRQLLEFPESGVLVRELKGSIRLMRYRSHHIFYRTEGGDLVLVRVLHIRQEVARHLKS